MTAPADGGLLYQMWAQQAVSYTVNRLPLGRANNMGDLIRSPISLVWGAFVLRCYDQISDNIQTVQTRANVSKGVQMGNCQEHAAVGFDFLAKRGNRPIAIQARPNHAWVVIGFDRNCDFTQPSSFPDWSWVADPWQRQVYRTNTISGAAYYEPVILLGEFAPYPDYLHP